MLTDPLDLRRPALRAALEECSVRIEVRALRRDVRRAERDPATAGGEAPRGAAGLLARLPLGSVLELAAHRPDLVISQDFGALAMQAALYRSLSRRSRLLLLATEPPQRFGLRERMILSRADGVLVDGDAVAQAVEQLRFPASRIFQLAMPYDVEAFLSCGRTRSGPDAHRLVYAGDLSPQSGAADLLISVAAWAEQNPDRPVEIWWIGEGDLAGVLGAQPLPRTVSQRFLGRLDALGTAAAFGQCGLLAVPSLTDDRNAPVPEALAAGLPVVGSRRNRRVRQLVREDVNGWLFDPLQPTDMFGALSRALGSPAERLDGMRDQARAAVRPAVQRGFSERFRKAFAAVMPDIGPDLEPQLAP